MWGIDGTMAITGSAVACQLESIEGEHRVQVEEFMSGLGELIGFRKHDEREFVDITIVPKVAAASGSLDDALEALRYPTVPAKVAFTSMLDTAAKELYGDSAASPKTNEYIYVGGARRTMVGRNQAALKLQAFRPKTSPLTIDQLLTEAT